jgi:hypothetical protein
MNFIVLFVLLGINGAAALRERAVIANDPRAGPSRRGLGAHVPRPLRSRVPVRLDSPARSDDRDRVHGRTGANVAIARVQRGEVESTVVDSLVAHLAGTPRDTVSKKRP